MILDTSVIIAILQNEPEAENLKESIIRSSRCYLSAASYLEACIVISTKQIPNGTNLLDELLKVLNITLIPTSIEQAYIARDAFLTYGKGHHKAALNFGDCFAYALAKSHNLPLLYKGNDFTLTDIQLPPDYEHPLP